MTTRAARSPRAASPRGADATRRRDGAIDADDADATATARARASANDARARSAATLDVVDLTLDVEAPRAATATATATADARGDATRGDDAEAAEILDDGLPTSKPKARDGKPTARLGENGKSRASGSGRIERVAEVLQSPEKAWPREEAAAEDDDDAKVSVSFELEFCAAMREGLEGRRTEAMEAMETLEATVGSRVFQNADAAAAEARTRTRSAAKRARRIFREETKLWAAAVVKAQQLTIDDDVPSTSEPVAMELPFWQRISSEHLGASSARNTKIFTQRTERPYSSDPTDVSGWKLQTIVGRQSVPRIDIGSAKAVPPYAYFAYSTHCNSYEAEGNVSRLLFRDDDGEFLESDPVDRREDESNELTREQEIIMCAICAEFSEFILTEKEVVRGVNREDGVKAVVVQTAEYLNLDENQVKDWFDETRTKHSTSRAWCMFLEVASHVRKLMGFSSAHWRAKMANTFSVLETLGISELFWRKFSRIIINCPTLAPLKKPVIVFDNLNEAMDQLAGMFCPRCFIFDCRTHGSLQPKSEGRKLDAERKLAWRERMAKSGMSAEKPLAERRCSTDCWYQTEEYKYYSAQTTCAPCDPTETLNRPSTKDPFIETTRKWRNAMDIEVLKKAVKIIGEKTTACEAALFFGRRRTCAEVGKQMHCLDLINLGTVVKEEERDAMDEDTDELSNPKKRKRAPTGVKNPTIARRLKMQKDADFLETQYSPCECVGACDANTCSCIKNGTFCERFCNCGPKCHNEFEGCKCDSTKRATCGTRTCPCYAAGRECTPDKCKRCCKTADAYSLPARKRYGLVDPNMQLPMPAFPCENMKLQLRQKEHICLGRSGVAGWGAFVLKGARKGEFIGEYVGELVTQDEAERRGTVYDVNNCSYLFNLNSEWCVDAQYRGNKLRFANHSKNPNCVPRVLAVNGDHRLALISDKDIKPGDELLFDYNYKDEVAPDWHEKNASTLPKSKHLPTKSAKKSSN